MKHHVSIKRQFLSLNPLVVFYYFAITAFFVRGIIFFALKYGNAPAVFFRGAHIHHFTWGFLLVGAFLYYAKEGAHRWVLEILLGVGLGLLFDEFIFWTLLRFDYWNMQNFYALTGLSAAAGTLSFLHPKAFSINIKHRHKVKHYSFKKQVLFPMASFVTIMLMFFYFQ